MTNVLMAEIQGQNRRPSKEKAHGVPWWCRSRKHRKFTRLHDKPPQTNLPQMADKESMWISKAEWEEQGARSLEKLGAR